MLVTMDARSEVSCSKDWTDALANRAIGRRGFDAQGARQTHPIAAV